MVMVPALEVKYKGEIRTYTANNIIKSFELIDEPVTQSFFINNMSESLKDRDIMVLRQKRREDL